MSLPAVRFRIPLGAGFSGKYHVSLLSILGHCFDVSNVYDKFNAPKWMQDCMLSGELKWHTNERV